MSFSILSDAEWFNMDIGSLIATNITALSEFNAQTINSSSFHITDTTELDNQIILKPSALSIIGVPISQYDASGDFLYQMPDSSGTFGQQLTLGSSSQLQWTDAVSGIQAVDGTANQIVATSSGSTVTLKLADYIVLPGGSIDCSGINVDGGIDCQTLASNEVSSSGVYSHQLVLTNASNVNEFTFPIISAAPSNNNIIIANNSGGSSFNTISTLLSSPLTTINIGNSSGLATIDVSSSLIPTNGTFTPTVSFGSGSTGITYSLQQGYYTSQGDVVTFTINISLSNKGSSTGSVAISGFPFTGRLPLTNQNALLSGNDITFLSGYLIAGLASNQFILYNTTSATGSTPLDDTNFTNSSDIFISGSVLI